MEKNEKIELLKSFNDFMNEGGKDGIINFYYETIDGCNFTGMFEVLWRLGKDEGLEKLEKFMKKVYDEWWGDVKVIIEVKCLDCKGKGKRNKKKCRRCYGEGVEDVKNDRSGILGVKCRDLYLKMGEDYLNNVEGVKEEVENYLNNQGFSITTPLK